MQDGVIRIRFLFLITHFLFLLMILIFKQEAIAKKNVQVFLDIKEGDLQAHYLQDDLEKIISRYTIIFGVSITLLAVEFLSFIGGISMFLRWQNQVSTFCHFIGICLLTVLLYLRWNEELFYLSFVMCTILPFVTELFPAVNYALVKV